MNEARNAETEAMDWMKDYQGVGQESLSADVRSVPFLNLVQPDSSMVSDETPPGTWRNSSNGRSYGSMVRVSPLAFHVIWAERDPKTYKTVARYEPRSIEVEVRQPRAGEQGYPKMYSKASGNEVQEQYVYALILPDFPEDGVLYFNPSLVSMKTCRNWNTMLFGQTLGNGIQAPIFAFSWNLCAQMVPNPRQPNKEIAKFVKAQRDSLVGKEFFEANINPQLATIKQATLLIANSEESEPEQA